MATVNGTSASQVVVPARPAPARSLEAPLPGDALNVASTAAPKPTVAETLQKLRDAETQIKAATPDPQVAHAAQIAALKAQKTELMADIQAKLAADPTLLAGLASHEAKNYSLHPLEPDTELRFFSLGNLGEAEQIYGDAIKYDSARQQATVDPALEPFVAKFDNLSTQDRANLVAPLSGDFTKLFDLTTQIQQLEGQPSTPWPNADMIEQKIHG